MRMNTHKIIKITGIGLMLILVLLCAFISSDFIKYFNMVGITLAVYMLSYEDKNGKIKGLS